MNHDSPDIPPNSAADANRVVSLGLLVLVTLLAGGIRFYRAGESLWVDELHTAWVVAEGPAEIPARARIGNYSPLYFHLVWGTTQALGTSELSLRLISLLAGVLLVPLAYWAVVRWTDSPMAGLLTATLLAIDRRMLFFAGEARPYALIQLLGLVHVLLFWRLLRCSSVACRLLYLVVSVLLFYLHYTTILLVAAEVVCYLALACRNRAALVYRPAHWLLDMVTLAVCCLPAVGHLREIAARRENWATFIDQAPSLMIFRWDLYVALPLSGLAAMVAVRWARRRTVRDQLPPGKAWLLIGCWLMVPVALVWIMTVTDTARMFMRRYVAASVLAPIVLTGFCFAACQSKAARWLFALVMLTAAVWSGGVFLHDGSLVKERNEDWRGAVQFIRQSEDDRQLPVLVYAGLVELNATINRDAALREYGLLPVTGIYRLDEASRAMIPLPFSGHLQWNDHQRQTIEKAGQAWLILRGKDDMADFLVNQFPGNFSIVERHHFGNVTVVLLKPSEP